MGLRRKLKTLLFNKRWIDLTAVLPAYEVTGAGSHALRIKLTMQTINQMPDALSMLVETLSPKQPRPIVNVDEFAAGTSQQGADAFKPQIVKCGSVRGYSPSYMFLLQNCIKL
jgi:hypothetical protein